MARSQTPVRVTLKTVTPDQAKTWLDPETVNIRNRHVRRTAVNNLVADMLNERWFFTGETIVFDTEGHLSDGQHRLQAVVEAGTSQRFVVVTGVDPEAQRYIDSGLKRTAADAITLSYEDVDSVHVAAVARAVLLWRNQPARPTQAEVIQFADSDLVALQHAAGLARVVHSAIGGRRNAYGVAAYYLNEVDPHSTITFFTSLATGDNLKRGDARLMLRNFLIKRGAGPGAGIRAAQLRAELGLTFKAWNAWREGHIYKPDQVLMFKKTDKFPEPV